jgi:hypothetical protein
MKPRSADELELAFSTEPIVGWRVWRVLRPIDRKLSALELAAELLEAEQRGEPRPVERLFRYRLRSLTQPVFWPPRTRLEARCNVERADGFAHGGGPDAYCECGLWALRCRDLAEHVLASYADSGVSLALGRLALWGRIVEQERGWRGQYAYPLDLTVLSGTGEMERDLREDYGIAVSLAREQDRTRRRRRAA